MHSIVLYIRYTVLQLIILRIVSHICLVCKICLPVSVLVLLFVILFADFVVNKRTYITEDEGL